MSAVQFTIIPPPDSLQPYVECFRISRSTSEEDIKVRVCPNGFPGIAFQHSKGDSALESITIPSGRDDALPTLFLYGQVTTLSEMHFTPPYVALQVVLKPHALWSLFKFDAATLANQSLSAKEFAASDLNARLIAANTDEERVAACCDFLSAKLNSAQESNSISKALALIDERIDTISIEELRKETALSERQLERHFKHIVGISPYLYIRIRRINAALRLMDSGKYDRLVDVAHALNFHDQSHFIRDIKEFAGLTPKSIVQKVDELYHDQVGTAYLLF